MTSEKNMGPISLASGRAAVGSSDQRFDGRGLLQRRIGPVHVGGGRLHEPGEDAERVRFSTSPPLARRTRQPAWVARPQAALTSAVRPEPHGPSMAMHRLGTSRDWLKMASSSVRNWLRSRRRGPIRVRERLSVGAGVS